MYFAVHLENGSCVTFEDLPTYQFIDANGSTSDMSSYFIERGDPRILHWGA